jgi:hypothetical protein
MNIVDESKDGVVRQVMPADFSFLSLADRQITNAMSKLVLSLTGLSDDKPIVLGVVSTERNNTFKQYAFGPATLLWNGLIVECPKIQSNGVFASWNDFLRGMYISPVSKNVSPSPVYGDGLVKDVYVHKVVQADTVRGENECSLSDLQFLPQISTNEQGNVDLSGGVGLLERVEL